MQSKLAPTFLEENYNFIIILAYGYISFTIIASVVNQILAWNTLYQETLNLVHATKG